MGVVNLTPDSFSDGGEAATAGRMRAKVASLLSLGIDMIDFGAQSTAPGNRSVGMDGELARLELLFGEFPGLGLDGLEVSIDTFRPTTFAQAHERLRGMGFAGPLVWNDVSGVVDDETVGLLRDLPDVRYVLAHTFVRSKPETPRHVEFTRPTLDVQAVADRLGEGVAKLSWMADRVILDPAFGFSKTGEQGFMLLSGLGRLLGAFGPATEWLFGLSRKSMLQRLFPDDAGFFQSELAHVLVLDRIASLRPRAVFRVHDPRVVRALEATRSRLDGPFPPSAPRPAPPDPSSGGPSPNGSSRRPPRPK